VHDDVLDQIPGGTHLPQSLDEDVLDQVPGGTHLPQSVHDYVLDQIPGGTLDAVCQNEDLV